MTGFMLAAFALVLLGVVEFYETALRRVAGSCCAECATALSLPRWLRPRRAA